MSRKKINKSEKNYIPTLSGDAVRLREIRNALGCSQKELAEKLGVQPSIISEIESSIKGARKKRRISRKMALGLAKEGFNIHWIYTGVGDPFVKKIPDTMFISQEPDGYFVIRIKVPPCCKTG